MLSVLKKNQLNKNQVVEVSGGPPESQNSRLKNTRLNKSKVCVYSFLKTYRMLPTKKHKHVSFLSPHFFTFYYEPTVLIGGSYRC